MKIKKFDGQFPTPVGRIRIPYQKFLLSMRPTDAKGCDIIVSLSHNQSEKTQIKFMFASASVSDTAVLSFDTDTSETKELDYVIYKTGTTTTATNAEVEVIPVFYKVNVEDKGY